MAVQYSDLDAAVRVKFLPLIVNQVFKATPLLVRLLTKHNVVLDSGKKIAQPIMYNELPGGSYWGMDTFDISYAETTTYAEWPWAANYVNVTIPGTELAIAEGDEEIVGLLKPKMEAASFTIKKKLATQCYGDGTGNGGKDMQGLQNAIDDGTNYPTYGGITRTTETWWAAQYDGTGGAMGLDLLQNMYGQCTDGDVHPDLILMRQNLWDKLWFSVQAQQRFGEIPPNQQDITRIGFSGFMFNQALVVPDNYVMPENAVYVLNTDYVHLVINRKKNFTWTAEKTPTDADAYVRQLLVMGQLICTAPFRSGKILNVS